MHNQENRSNLSMNRKLTDTNMEMNQLLELSD